MLTSAGVLQGYVIVQWGLKFVVPLFSPPILYETFDSPSHVQSGTGQLCQTVRAPANFTTTTRISLSLATTSSPRGQLSIAVRLCQLDITQAWTSTVSCTVLSQTRPTLAQPLHLDCPMKDDLKQY